LDYGWIVWTRLCFSTLDLLKNITSCVNQEISWMHKTLHEWINDYKELDKIIESKTKAIYMYKINSKYHFIFMITLYLEIPGSTNQRRVHA
jgi:hypothetical protein